METDKHALSDGASLPNPKDHFPLFRGPEDVLAYCEKTRDSYYLTAFMLESWLGGLISMNVTKYADVDPTKRGMQTGEAFRHDVFRDLFALCRDQSELLHFLQSLLRFAGEDDTLAELVTRTFGLFGTENNINPVVDLQTIRPGPNAAELTRRYLRRFCDWLDCLLHHEVHFMSYAIPGSFFPGDEEARHLFSLGLSETVLPELSSYDQTFWRWNHETAVKDLTKPDKWKFHVDGVKHEGKRHHTHPEVDDCVIGFWPLVKRFNWSYNELQTALVHVLPHYTGRYPCDCYVSLQKHCTQTLGLKKGTGGKRGSVGKPTKQLEQLNPPFPEGFDVVKAFLATRDAAKR